MIQGDSARLGVYPSVKVTKGQATEYRYHKHRTQAYVLERSCSGDSACTCDDILVHHALGCGSVVPAQVGPRLILILSRTDMAPEPSTHTPVDTLGPEMIYMDAVTIMPRYSIRA